MDCLSLWGVIYCYLQVRGQSGSAPAEGKARFGRTSSEESMKSCVASRTSEEFSLLNEVSYVLDGHAGDELRAKAGELGRSLGENLNR